MNVKTKHRPSEQVIITDEQIEEGKRKYFAAGGTIKLLEADERTIVPDYSDYADTFLRGESRHSKGLIRI